MSRPRVSRLAVAALGLLAFAVAAGVYERAFQRSLAVGVLVAAAGPVALVLGVAGAWRSRSVVGRGTAALAVVLGGLLTTFVGWIIWFGLTQAS